MLSPPQSCDRCSNGESNPIKTAGLRKLSSKASCCHTCLSNCPASAEASSVLAARATSASTA